MHFEIRKLFYIHHVILLIWYLLILRVPAICVVLCTVLRKQRIMTRHNPWPQISHQIPKEKSLHWTPLALHWVSFVSVYWEWGWSVANHQQKKKKKSFSALAPANTFNHFKLQLETELEGNPVENPFVNKSPARRQIAFLPMKSSVPGEHTFKSNPSLQASVERKERPHRKCNVIGHPGRNGTKPGQHCEALVWPLLSHYHS